MKGISFLTDEEGQKKAVVIDFDLLKDRDSLLDILDDIEDEVTINLRKDESSVDWEEVRSSLVSKD